MFKSRDEVIKAIAQVETLSLSSICDLIHSTDNCIALASLIGAVLPDPEDDEVNNEVRLMRLYRDGLAQIAAKKAADEPVLGLLPSLN